METVSNSLHHTYYILFTFEGEKSQNRLLWKNSRQLSVMQKLISINSANGRDISDKCGDDKCHEGDCTSEYFTNYNRSLAMLK